MSHPAYERMRKIVDKIVTHYRTDFTTHDTAHLDNLDTSEPFLWFARPYGTHLFSRPGIANDKARGWSGFAPCVASINRSEPQGSGWYLWDGSTFRIIDKDRARSLLQKWEDDAPPKTEENKRARYLRGGW